MSYQIFTAILIFFAGGFSIFCSVKDFDWFFNNRKARMWISLWGRKGARIFFIVFGIFVIFCGIMMIVTGSG